MEQILAVQTAFFYFTYIYSDLYTKYEYMTLYDWEKILRESLTNLQSNYFE